MFSQYNVRKLVRMTDNSWSQPFWTWLLSDIHCGRGQRWDGWGYQDWAVSHSTMKSEQQQRVTSRWKIILLGNTKSWEKLCTDAKIKVKHKSATIMTRPYLTLIKNRQTTALKYPSWQLQLSPHIKHYFFEVMTTCCHIVKASLSVMKSTIEIWCIIIIIITV